MSLEVGVNSYISVADADTYFGDRLFADSWEAANDTDRAKALVMATRRLEALFFVGKKSATDQAMQFPRLVWSEESRLLRYDPNHKDNMTGWVDIGIPQVVKDVVCEEALFLLSMTSSDRERDKLHSLGIVGRSIEEFNEYAQQSVVQKAVTAGRGLQSPEARQLIAPYLLKVGGVT